MKQQMASYSAEKLADLRTVLAASNLDGFLVPMADSFPGDQISAPARRLEFLTSFTGSAGMAVVLSGEAAFFTDSRYTLQAQNQVRCDLYSIFDAANLSPVDWLRNKFSDPAGAKVRIGFDPWLHTAGKIALWQKSLAGTCVHLEAVRENPIDGLWHNRPEQQHSAIWQHLPIYSGKTSHEKRMQIADVLRKQSVDAFVLSDPASVCWLLNVRGNDVPYTPIVPSYAIIDADGGLVWLIDGRKITPELKACLDDEITCRDITDIRAVLGEFTRHKKDIRIGIDEHLTPEALATMLHHTGASVLNIDDPCALPRACKNDIEVAGMRAAHRRDGAALAKFFAWLAEQPAGRVTEIGIDEKLSSLRAEGALFRGLSFPTIAAADAHGAIVHYNATEQSSLTLRNGSVLLLDSGGQYDDGTTDVTRTVLIGDLAPPAELCECFTRVLKGHIALASAVFPSGTAGSDLDVLARQYLWAVGRDYEHGTGHGVGCFMCVHEGPQGISKRNHQALVSGMVLSNEPGYYREDCWGIRLENLQVVVKTEMTDKRGREFLTFEPLTFVPFERRLIDKAMLTLQESAWLNAYHMRVRAEIMPLLGDEKSRQWLNAATEEI